MAVGAILIDVPRRNWQQRQYGRGNLETGNVDVLGIDAELLPSDLGSPVRQTLVPGSRVIRDRIEIGLHDRSDRAVEELGPAAGEPLGQFSRRERQWTHPQTALGQARTDAGNGLWSLRAGS